MGSEGFLCCLWCFIPGRHVKAVWHAEMTFRLDGVLWPMQEGYETFFRRYGRERC